MTQPAKAKLKFTRIPEGRYCGTVAFAAAAGVTLRNVDALIQRKSIKVIKFARRGTLISEKTALAYIAEREKKHAGYNPTKGSS